MERYNSDRLNKVPDSLRQSREEAALEKSGQLGIEFQLWSHEPDTE